jgi:hypothetical protein
MMVENTATLPGALRFKQAASKGIVDMLIKEGFTLSYNFVLFKPGVTLVLTKGDKIFTTSGSNLVDLILALPMAAPAKPSSEELRQIAIKAHMMNPDRVTLLGE